MMREFELIDFHAHILPRADHGSSSLQTSLEQMTLINNAGVDTVVATPHFYPDQHILTDFLHVVDSSARELTAVDDRPSICLGAEVLCCVGLENMDGIDSLCIRGTDILLLELPYSEWDIELFYTVRRLSRRYTVILVHIDRYIETHFDGIDTLLSMGIPIQVNAAAFFTSHIRKRLAPYINDGLISALGSDLHEVDKRAYAQFSRLEKRIGEEYFNIMKRSEILLGNAEKY